MTKGESHVALPLRRFAGIKNGGSKGSGRIERMHEQNQRLLGVRHVESLVARPQNNAVARASLSSAVIPSSPPFLMLVSLGWLSERSESRDLDSQTMKDRTRS